MEARGGSALWSGAIFRSGMKYSQEETKMILKILPQNGFCSLTMVSEKRRDIGGLSGERQRVSHIPGDM